jgi:flagellar hook-length control protein FliK
MINPIAVSPVEPSRGSTVTKAVSGATDAPKSFTETLAASVSDDGLSNGDTPPVDTIAGTAAAVPPSSVEKTQRLAPTVASKRQHGASNALANHDVANPAKADDKPLILSPVDPVQDIASLVDRALNMGSETGKKASDAGDTQPKDEEAQKKKTEATPIDPKLPEAQAAQASVQSPIPALMIAPVPAAAPSAEPRTDLQENPTSNDMVGAATMISVQATSSNHLQKSASTEATGPSMAKVDAEGETTASISSRTDEDYLFDHAGSQASVAKEAADGQTRSSARPSMASTTTANAVEKNENQQTSLSDGAPATANLDLQTSGLASPTLAPNLAFGLNHKVAPLASAPMAASSSGPVPYGMLPIEIGMGVLQGQRAIEVRLSPEDLGNVEIRLSISDDSKVSADIKADRPETLAMMMQDASTLRNALDQTGLTTTSDTLQFSLKQDSGFAQGNGGNAGQRQNSGQTPSHPQQGASVQRSPEAMPIVSLRRVAGLLDVNI